MTERLSAIVREYIVRVTIGPVALDGVLRVPEKARAVVLFAHGSGSGRHSPRNRYVAGLLNEAEIATLLVDLLTADEEAIDARTGHLRFDIELLAQRLVGATDWLTQRPDTRHLAIGYFGASTGAAAALVAATQRSDVKSLELSTKWHDWRASGSSGTSSRQHDTP
jgi:putative phosphoribosyl transferase